MRTVTLFLLQSADPCRWDDPIGRFRRPRHRSCLNYRLFNFAGTQKSKGQIADATDGLERDAIVYAHSENFIQLCAKCWRSPEVDHEHHGALEKHVVTGRIAAPADFDPRELLRQLDAAMAKQETCRLYVPDLCEAAGLSERAAFERRRFEMIRIG